MYVNNYFFDLINIGQSKDTHVNIIKKPITDVVGFLLSMQSSGQSRSARMPKTKITVEIAT
jgi:hypothetical protein